jgi:site-specific recombinase XerD
LPRYVQAFFDRHGNARFYFRRKGFARVALPRLPWSPDFMAAYEAAMSGQVQTIAVPRAKQGSFAALAASYLASTAFLTMKPSTKGVYRNAIERLCRSKDKDGNEIGSKSTATMQREHVVKLMAARAEKPESANLLRKVLRAMMQHAVETGMRTDDPTRDVKAIRVKSNGFHSWTDAEIAQFEAHHAIGSRPRLALALLLCTGQRRSDVVTMSPAKAI